MTRIYNTDNFSVMPAANDGLLRRQKAYGAIPGTVAASEYPDQLVSKEDYKERIKFAHDNRMFAYYHQSASWQPVDSPDGQEWNQNGLNYCWAWSAAAALSDAQAREGKIVKKKAPTTLGFLVNWKNEGNYLESGIQGLIERGVAEIEYVSNMHSRDYKRFLEGWEENALLNRLESGAVWDCDNSNGKGTMIQHCVTGLVLGFPLYIAYNWWGHAVECVAVEWDETQANNLTWWIRNSHNEKNIIKLTGDRAVPSEAYVFRASVA